MTKQKTPRRGYIRTIAGHGKSKNIKRPFIDEETRSVGIGPMEFNVEVARAHGWTDVMIEHIYFKMAALVNRGWGIAQRRKPELYRRNRHAGNIIFIGPIGNDPGLKVSAKDYEPIKKAPKR